MSNKDKLVSAFSQALAIPADQVVGDLSYNCIPEWDSVAHMALIAELESAFDVMLDTDEILAMSSFSLAEQILSKHGVAF